MLVVELPKAVRHRKNLFADVLLSTLFWTQMRIRNHSMNITAIAMIADILTDVSILQILLSLSLMMTFQQDCQAINGLRLIFWPVLLLIFVPSPTILWILAEIKLWVFQMKSYLKSMLIVASIFWPSLPITKLTFLYSVLLVLVLSWIILILWLKHIGKLFLNLMDISKRLFLPYIAHLIRVRIIWLHFKRYLIKGKWLSLLRIYVYIKAYPLTLKNGFLAFCSRKMNIILSNGTISLLKFILILFVCK